MRPSIPGSEKSTPPSLAEYLLEPSRDLNAQRLCVLPDSRFSKKQWRFVFLPQALKISLPRHAPSGAGPLWQDSWHYLIINQLGGSG